MTRSALLAWLTFWLAGCATAVRAETPVGIRADKPASGRFVQTDLGYMVPYTLEIPGTKVRFSMQPIPGGKVRIGSPDAEDGHQADEGPQVDVTVEPFWLGTYEVTWAEYKEFMSLYVVFKEFESRKIRVVNDDNLADAITAPTELYEPSFTFEHGEDPRLPAVTMTQYAAKQYTKWLSAITDQQYRLPCNSEWEHACRAGTTTAYHFGDEAKLLDEHGWYYDNADEMPHKVGEKKPNPWGLYDMHGNVWEWVLDEYLEDGYQKFAGKTLKSADSIAWPTKQYPRVVRGGSWDDDADRCRAAAKLGSHDVDWKDADPNLPLSPWWYTSDPARGVGFRILRPLREVSKKELSRYWEMDDDDIRADVKNRLDEGRGAIGLVDRKLPEAIRQLSE